MAVINRGLVTRPKSFRFNFMVMKVKMFQMIILHAGFCVFQPQMCNFNQLFGAQSTRNLLKVLFIWRFQMRFLNFISFYFYKVKKEENGCKQIFQRLGVISQKLVDTKKLVDPQMRVTPERVSSFGFFGYLSYMYLKIVAKKSF